MMRKKIVALGSAFAMLASSFTNVIPVAQAQILPDIVTQGVLQIRAYKDDTYSEEAIIKMGSGVFVDNGGCFVTNTHVVLDLESEYQEQLEEFLQGNEDHFDYVPSGKPHPVHDYLEARLSVDRAKEPEPIGKVQVIYSDESRDLAYGCIVDADERLFTHYYDRVYEPQFTQHQFGEHIWLVGYPGDGERSITVAPGQIVGFVDSPDVTDWVGLPNIKSENLQLYKVDALSGPGVSGGLMLSEDLKFIGVPFAGNFNPGGFIFTLSEDMYLTFERELRWQMYRDGVIPLDCAYDAETGFYTQAGLKFYDFQCSQAFDEAMEKEAKDLYQAFCGWEIDSHLLVTSIKRSKEIGDLGAYSDYIDKICPL